MKVDRPTIADNLRNRAQALLAKAPGAFQAEDVKNVNELAHELAVHQAELELQNEELRNKQRALQQTRDRFATLFENAPCGYVVLDASGIIRQTNTTWLAMLRRPGEDLRGTPFAETLVEEDATAFLSRFRAFFRNPTEKRIVARIKRKGAAASCVQIEARPHNAAPPNAAASPPSELMVIISDITERIQVEEDARRNAERLRAVIDILQHNSGSIQEFLDYSLTKAIEVTGSKIGYIYFYDEKRRQFILNTWSKEVMQECAVVDPQTCYELDKTGVWGEAVRQRKPIVLNDFESQHPLKRGYPEGHVHLTRFLTIPIFHQGRIVAVAGVANKETDYDQTDVLEMTLLMDAVWKSAENLKSQQELREREAYQRRILETTVDGFWVVDNKGCVVDVNDAYCAMSGYTREELIGMGINDLDSEEKPAETRERIERIIKNGAEIFETNHRRKDGTAFPVEISTSYLKERGGQFICFCRDLTQRHQDQTRLSALGGILDDALASITIHDTEGRFIFANAATASMHGYESLDEFMQINLHELDVPASQALLAKRLREIAKTGEARFEVEHYRKDGSTFPLQVLAKHIEWDGCQAILSIATDITERKQAEEALRESEQRLALATRSANIGIWDWDIANNKMAWDDQMFRLYGIKERPKSYGVEIWGNGLHPDDRDFAWEACQAALRGEKQYDIEFRVCWPDGTVRYIKGQGIVLRDHARNPVRMLGTNFDITARREAESMLRAAERRNQSLLDHSPACHKIVDLDLNLQYMSKNGFQMLKLDETANVYGKPYPFDFFPEAFREGMKSCLERVKATGKTITFEALANDIKGNSVWLHSTLMPVRNDKDELEYITVVTSDLTQEKRLENDLRQSQKLESVGQLAGGVAHDFNNMLNVILGHAELALEGLAAESPLRADLVEIRKAAERSANLTRQLLAFARKQTVTPRDLDLNETIASMLKMLERLIGEDIDLLWKPGTRLALVHIDPGQVDQILANLAVNARDAIGRQNGKMTIETANASFDEEYCANHTGFKPGAYVMLAVSDNGCGMDEETRSHIFEPFFTTKEVGQGTGLGLATIYGILKQNGGFVNVYSEPGKGTTFRIYLPALDAESRQQDDGRNTATTPTGGSETILVVEDQPAMLNLAKIMLESVGYNVLTAATPGEAVDLARDHAGTIDLLITDVVMPEMNGRELAGKLQSLYPSLSTLFMSGYTADVIAHQGVLDKGVDFIEKPFRRNDLSKKVREVLDS